jgi:hypothetical protein
MSDRLYGGIRAGGASITVPIMLKTAATGLGATGKVAADLSASYWRQGGSRVAITLTDLSNITDAWASGGLKEVDATNMPGIYRLDLPDLAVVSGADFLVLTVKGAGLFEWNERYALESRRALRRKQAFSNYTFVMRQSANPGLGATGLTVTAVRRLDNGSFAACANSVVEVANGAYSINLADTDTDGNYVTFRFSAPGALDTWVSHVLEPSGV